MEMALHRIISELKLGVCRIQDSYESIYSPPPPIPKNTDLSDSRDLVLEAWRASAPMCPPGYATVGCRQNYDCVV